MSEDLFREQETAAEAETKQMTQPEPANETAAQTESQQPAEQARYTYGQSNTAQPTGYTAPQNTARPTGYTVPQSAAQNAGYTAQQSTAQNAGNTAQQRAAQSTERTAQQSTYSWVQRDQQTQQTWNAQPHYNYYQRQQAQQQAVSRQNVRQEKKKQRSRWATVVAMALVFGLIAGALTYGINLLGNKIYPVTQGETAETLPEKPATLSLATTGSGSSTATTASTGTGSGNSVAQVAADAMPSLVTIATVSVQEMRSFFGVQQYEAEGAGTGVIVGENDTELLIATNEHVIKGASQISVGFINEEVVSAQIKGEDEDSDLAIIAVKKSDVPEETLAQIKIAVIGDSDALVLGEQVVAIGNALGVGQSVTSGYVSALGRELNLSDGRTEFVATDLIQTDAAINSGNSGGALLNMNGELVGINEAKSAYTSSGVTVDNVGYAIPMAKAQPILEEMMNQVTREVYGEDEQGYLGVSLADVSTDMAKMYNMPEGVCFTSVAEGSPAAKAGAQKGDVLTEVGGRSIKSSEALMKEMQYYRSGETVEMKVLRADNGEYKEVTLSVTLGTKDVLDAFAEKNE